MPGSKQAKKMAKGAMGVKRSPAKENVKKLAVAKPSIGEAAANIATHSKVVKKGAGRKA